MIDDQKIRSYRDLKIWQHGMDVAVDLYRLTAAFPKFERYGLSSQMQRAAVSIPSNVAEGHARDSTKEYLHHVSIAIGSLAELETQVILSGRLQYATTTRSEGLLQQLDEAGKMLYGLQRSLKAKL
jgi:four helix bundle protein